VGSPALGIHTVSRFLHVARIAASSEDRYKVLPLLAATRGLSFTLSFNPTMYREVAATTEKGPFTRAGPYIIRRDLNKAFSSWSAHRSIWLQKGEARIFAASSKERR